MFWLEPESKTAYVQGVTRKPTSLSLRSKERARAMFLTTEERTEIARRWTEENKVALEASNAWVAEQGLPLEKYRLF